MEGLLDTLLKLISPWDNSFPRKKSSFRAKAMCVALLLTLGRKLFSRAIATSGRDQLDWSADYRLFSRCRWSPCILFRPIVCEAAKLVNESIITVGFDDTLVKKTGKKIKGTSWQRDSMSPHFCNNFVWGMRYLQASFLLPLYNNPSPRPCRGIPVQFTQLPKFKKPKRKDAKEKWLEYENLSRKYNTSTEFVKQTRYLRHELDLAGYKSKKLLVVVDSSFVNKTCLLADIPNIDIIGRTRKNARFFFRAKEKTGKRFYERKSYTAEELRQEESVPYKITTAHYAGEYKEVRYKEYSEVFWKWGTKRKPLRLIIVAPTPYRKTHNSRLYYRDPAYLLTTDFETPAPILIQKYLDRWQIEVNFKEEKSQMCLGKQQVWSPRAIPRAPAFIAACYAAIMLAGVLHFSDSRNHPSFERLPKWRKNEDRRPSFQDYMVVLRNEVMDRIEFSAGGIRLKVEKKDLITKAWG
jgi:hypothetical protein